MKNKDTVMSEQDAKDIVAKYQNEYNYIVNERLRTGFIGMEKVVGGMRVLQTERGNPVGTLAAIPYGKDIILGVSQISEDDKQIQKPIIGLALAIENAVSKKSSSIESGASPDLNYFPQLDGLIISNKYVSQIKHFIKRARAYYFPEIYSYSKGMLRPSEDDCKIWNKNHSNRMAVLNRFTDTVKGEN